MPLTLRVKVDKSLFLMRDKRSLIATAAVAALRETAAESVQEGHRNIAAAGPGFTRAGWLSGLQYRTKDAKTEGGEPSLQAKAIIFHKYGIAGVFEHGADIEAKSNRLLWIPTSHGAPPASKSGKKLTSATINGTPVLFDAADRDPHRKPLYIGVKSTRIPKKFRIAEIAKKHVKQIGSVFSKLFKDK